MTQRFRLIGIFITLTLLITVLAAPALGNGNADDYRQTWPSRTPTPLGPPEQPNPPGTEPPPERTPGATAEPGSSPTATAPSPGAVSSPGPGVATLPPIISGTTAPESTGQEGGEDGFAPVELPRAAEIGECGLPPVVVALGPVNVRSGPGIEYDVVANLGYQDERPVAGRATFAPWWLILLSPGQHGWVSDQAVTVQGYTGAVQVVAEDPTGEESRPAWNPTPNPVCTPPARETISASVDQLAAAFRDGGSPPDAGIDQPEEITFDGQGNANPAPGFSLLQPEDVSSGANLIWLPVVGAFLILAGGIALIVQRRQH